MKPAAVESHLPQVCIALSTYEVFIPHPFSYSICIMVPATQRVKFHVCYISNS